MSHFARQIFESRVALQHNNSVIVSVIFTNQTSNHIKSLEFNVMDSLNTKLVRGVSNLTATTPQKMPFITTNHHVDAIKLNIRKCS